jgi:hypothetical protein
MWLLKVAATYLVALILSVIAMRMIGLVFEAAAAAVGAAFRLTARRPKK